MFKKYNVSATYKLYFLNTKSIGFEKTYQGFVVTTPPKGSRSNPVKKTLGSEIDIFSANKFNELKNYYHGKT